jgi:hypothetical protein
LSKIFLILPLKARNKKTAAKSVRPELVEGPLFMVRLAHHERLIILLII